MTQNRMKSQKVRNRGKNALASSTFFSNQIGDAKWDTQIRRNPSLQSSMSKKTSTRLQEAGEILTKKSSYINQHKEFL
jgi:hypothetical protein